MSPRGNKIHFTSLGCVRNLVDTEVMLGILLKAGYEPTPDLENADFLVVNTCGFLAEARAEALETLDELFASKKERAKIIVTGCMVQKHREEIKAEFPDIHFFLGSGDIDKILAAVRASESGEEISDARSFLHWGEIPRVTATPSHYAYLKIAEGCKKRCSFCIIPEIKGPLKSKSEDQILKEFHLLLDQGAFEIIFIAQDLGDYGKDLKEKSSLPSLLKKILQTKKNFWLRLLYLYPDEITDELIEIMKNDPRICPYVDMPIQHINDTILRAMHRKTSREQIISTIEKLRREIPQIVIRTSIIVGFPGETQSQFEELTDFVKNHPLDHVGIFKYSKEKSSYAARLPSHLSDEIKEKRFQKLSKVQQKVVQNLNKKYLKKTLDVLVEGYHPDSPYLMQGRFMGQCPDADGVVIINDGRNVTEFGKVYKAKITDIAGYDLIGTALSYHFSLKT